MQGTQLSFSPDKDEANFIKIQKKHKLGSYERIQRELEENESDSYKIFIEISSEKHHHLTPRSISNMLVRSKCVRNPSSS